MTPKTKKAEAPDSTWESLDRQGKSPATLHGEDLVKELARAGLAPEAGEMCARLCQDVSAESPRSTNTTMQLTTLNDRKYKIAWTVLKTA